MSAHATLAKASRTRDYRRIETGRLWGLRIKGSHHFLQHSDGRRTVVPVHSGETIGPGLLAKILKDVEMETEEFQKYL